MISGACHADRVPGRRLRALANALIVACGAAACAAACARGTDARPPGSAAEGVLALSPDLVMGDTGDS